MCDWRCTEQLRKSARRDTRPRHFEEGVDKNLLRFEHCDAGFELCLGKCSRCLHAGRITAEMNSAVRFDRGVWSVPAVVYGDGESDRTRQDFEDGGFVAGISISDRFWLMMKHTKSRRKTGSIPLKVEPRSSFLFRTLLVDRRALEARLSNRLARESDRTARSGDALQALVFIPA